MSFDHGVPSGPGLRDRMLAVDIGELAIDADLEQVRARAARRERTVVLGRAAVVAVVLVVAATSVGVARGREDRVVSTGTTVAGTTAPPVGSVVPAPTTATVPDAPTGRGRAQTLVAGRAVPIGRAATGVLRAALGSLWVGVAADEEQPEGLLRIDVADAAAPPVHVRLDRRVTAITNDAAALYVATWDASTSTGSLVRIDPRGNETSVVVSLQERVGSLAIAGGALWHTGLRGDDGQRMLVRTQLEPRTDTDPSVLIMPMGDAFLAAPDPEQLWALRSADGLVDRLTVLDPAPSRPSGGRVRAEHEVNGHPPAMVASALGGAWIGDQVVGTITYWSELGPAMISPPFAGAPIDLADASDPLTAAVFFVNEPFDVDGRDQPAEVRRYLQDDVGRQVDERLDIYERTEAASPVQPRAIELVASTLWVLDVSRGEVLAVDVSSLA